MGRWESSGREVWKFHTPENKEPDQGGRTGLVGRQMASEFEVKVSQLLGLGAMPFRSTQACGRVDR